MEKAERTSQKARPALQAHQPGETSKFWNKPKFRFGFEIPENYKHDIEIDKWNGNTHWQDVTKLELESMAAYEVFKNLGHKATPPPKYKTIQVHLICDVKHNGRCKARLVADGDLTDVPDNSVYFSVISL